MTMPREDDYLTQPNLEPYEYENRGGLPGLDSLRLENLERYAAERPLPAVLAAAALGYVLARTNLGSPVRATGLAIEGAGDLAGGAVKGTAHLAGEVIQGAGSLAAGVLGAAAPLAGGALGAGTHLGVGAFEAGRDVTVGTAKAGFKLGEAVLALLPTVAAVYLLNMYAGNRLERGR